METTNKLLKWSIKMAKLIIDTRELLPDVQKRALCLYTGVVLSASKENFKIPNHVSLIATATLIASREYPSCAIFTIQEICSMFQGRGHRVTRKMILKDLPCFERFCGLKHATHCSKDYLERLMSRLSIDPTFLDTFKQRRGNQDVTPYINTLSAWATRILDAIPKAVKLGRNPFILAAASIYAADAVMARATSTKRVLTQAILARATGMGYYSIRDHYCEVIKPILKESLLLSNSREKQPCIAKAG
nr:hypothetical protein [Candidatus Sigynarchaeota archaeon]